MVDVAIIGAGPAGMSAAINLRALGKTVTIFSGGNNNLIKTNDINNHLGFVNVSGKELMDSFAEHVASCNIELINSKITSALFFDDKFILNADSKLYEFNAVILCTGVLPAKQIDNESEFLGKGVSYCAVCDGMLYRGKKAFVWGLERDSYKEANMLASLGVNVSFVSKFKCKDKLNENIEFIDGKLSAVKGKDFLQEVCVNGSWIATDALFILRPVIPASSLIEGLEAQGPFINVDRKMKTNLDGVFAAGDCTGKPLQISKAVGEGQLAAYSASEYIENLRKEN